MKHITKISTLLIALTLAMSANAATQYCEKNVQSSVDNTNVSIKVTILKVENALRVTFDSDKIAGIRDGGNFRHWGNGTWSNQDDAVTNFEQGWTQNGTMVTKDFTFSTYPTSGTGEIYCLFDLVEGTPKVAGFTLTEIDLFNVSCDGSGDSGDSGDSEDPDLPIPSTGPSNVNWESFAWVPKNQCETCENQYKVETNNGCVIRADNIQDRNQNMSIYCVTAQVVTDCNIAYTSEGTGIWLHLSGLTSRETEVTLKFADGSTCSFWVLNDKAEPADDPSQPVGDGACIYEGIVGDGQIAGAGDLKIPFDEGYVVTLELNEDKTQLNIQLQLKEKDIDIENASKAYFLNYPEYDITKTINQYDLDASPTVPGLYTRSLPINQYHISNYEKGIILFAIKVEYPNHYIKVTLPEYFRLDGSDCPPRVFTVYHHDDFPSTEEESEYTCTQFNGGVIYQPIQYKRRMPSEVWETLSVPFDVESVTAFDPATGEHVPLHAQYNHNGATKAGHYWLRYFKTKEVTASNFQPNWYDIEATSDDAAKPEKDKAYIIRLPGGGYYDDKYIVFHGRGYQTIVSSSDFEVPKLPAEDYYSYSGNNTMMPQYLFSAYVLDNAGYYFTSSSTVTLPPFECSVNATAGTSAKMPRNALNGRNNTTTDLTLLPTTDLQGGVIYSIFGAAVARFNTIDEYDQACQTLAAGVYVVVTPSATTKIQIP